MQNEERPSSNRPGIISVQMGFGDHSVSAAWSGPSRSRFAGWGWHLHLLSTSRMPCCGNHGCWMRRGIGFCTEELRSPYALLDVMILCLKFIEIPHVCSSSYFHLISWQTSLPMIHRSNQDGRLSVWIHHDPLVKIGGVRYLKQTLTKLDSTTSQFRLWQTIGIIWHLMKVN